MTTSWTKFFSSKEQEAKGFTMIEIVVVIGILSLFLGIAVSKLRPPASTELNNQIQNITLLGRQLRSKARVHDRTYRLVFEFPDPQNDNETPAYGYRVEYSTSRILLKDPNAPSDMRLGSEAEEAAQKASSRFQQDSSILGQGSQTLPAGLKVHQIELYGHPQPISEGEAAIHFFPNGRVEESVIHLSWGENLDQERKWTIYFRPFTGDPEVLTDHVRLDQLRGQ